MGPHLQNKMFYHTKTQEGEKMFYTGGIISREIAFFRFASIFLEWGRIILILLLAFFLKNRGITLTWRNPEVE